MKSSTAFEKKNYVANRQKLNHTNLCRIVQLQFLFICTHTNSNGCPRELQGTFFHCCFERAMRIIQTLKNRYKNIRGAKKGKKPADTLRQKVTLKFDASYF